MYGNNLDADKLGIRDLVGEPTGNALINWIKGMSTTSQYLTTSPNANGSIDIDLNFALVANTILSLTERLAGEFKASVDGSKLTVAGGHVFLPDRAYILTDYTRNLTDGDAGDCLCINLTASSASYAWTAMPSTGIVTATGATLPLCRPFKTNGKWYVQHLHIGAYVLPFPPATIIAGYDESKVQALTHQAAGLAWGDYCPDCSDSSSSISTSSSSGSSAASTSASVSSSSGGGAWTGGYLLVTDDGMCNGQWTGNGSYYLTSGDPHSTSGVWTCAGVGVILYTTISSSSGWWIQAGGKNAIIHGDGGSGGDPTTWVDGTTWKGEVENEEHHVICFAPVTFIATQSVEDDLI